MKKKKIENVRNKNKFKAMRFDLQCKFYSKYCLLFVGNGKSSYAIPGLISIQFFDHKSFDTDEKY